MGEIKKLMMQEKEEVLEQNLWVSEEFGVQSQVVTMQRNWLQIGKRDQQRHEKSMPYRQKIFMVGKSGKHVYPRYLWLCHLENTDVVSIRSKSP